MQEEIKELIAIMECCACCLISGMDAERMRILEKRVANNLPSFQPLHTSRHHKASPVSNEPEAFEAAWIFSCAIGT